MSDIADIQQKLRLFARERDWEQFHSPKNLSVAIASEAGELLQLFQWLSGSESEAIMLNEENATQVRHEIADTLIYLVRLADVLGLYLVQAVHDKISVNATKYPIEKARGSAQKYTDLRSI